MRRYSIYKTTNHNLPLTTSSNSITKYFCVVQLCFTYKETGLHGRPKVHYTQVLLLQKSSGILIDEGVGIPDPLQDLLIFTLSCEDESAL